jgi:hypothetical protein
MVFSPGNRVYTNPGSTRVGQSELGLVQFETRFSSVDCYSRTRVRQSELNVKAVPVPQKPPTYEIFFFFIQKNQGFLVTLQKETDTRGHWLIRSFFFSHQGIDWQQVDFLDNRQCLSLIEAKPLGHKFSKVSALVHEEEDTCQCPSTCNAFKVTVE